MSISNPPAYAHCIAAPLVLSSPLARCGSRLSPIRRAIRSNVPTIDSLPVLPSVRLAAADGAAMSPANPTFPPPTTQPPTHKEYTLLWPSGMRPMQAVVDLATVGVNSGSHVPDRVLQVYGGRGPRGCPLPTLTRSPPVSWRIHALPTYNRACVGLLVYSALIRRVDH